MEEKVEEVEKEEENDRVWDIERRTTSPAGFGYPAGRWNGHIVEPAWTSSSSRCKWRIVIRGSTCSRQYYELRRCFRDVHGEKRDLLPD